MTDDSVPDFHVAVEGSDAEVISMPGSGGDHDEVRRGLEALLMVAEEPAEPVLIAQVLEISEVAVIEMCQALVEEYEGEGRGFTVVRVAGGFRFQTRPEAAKYVERFVLEGQSSRMSAAALETMAIVAYKQPISRAQVAAIRGVNVDGVMRTLQTRGLITEVSRDPGPGNAVMFGTSALFLERLGLDSLSDLPPLGAFVPAAEVLETLEQTLRVGIDEANLPDEAPEDSDPGD